MNGISYVPKLYFLLGLLLDSKGIFMVKGGKRYYPPCKTLMKISRNLKKVIIEKLTDPLIVKSGIVQPFTIIYDREHIDWCGNVTPHTFYKYLSNSLRVAGYPKNKVNNRDWWKGLNCYGFYSYRYTKTKLYIYLFIVSAEIVLVDDIALRTVNLCAYDYIIGKVDNIDMGDILFDNMDILDNFSGLEMFGLTNLKNEKLL